MIHWIGLKSTATVSSVSSTPWHAHASIHISSEVSSSATSKFLALVLSHTPALLTRKLIVTEVVVVVVAEVVLIVVGWALSSHHVAAAASWFNGNLTEIIESSLVTRSRPNLL